MSTGTSLPVLLIVDDEPDLREILCAELSFRGYKTIQKSGGFEAIAFLRKHKVDAVLTDLRMDGGSGIDLIQFLREEMPAPPPVIVISALADTAGPELRALGARAVFSKPFAIEALAQAVYDVINPAKGKTGRKHKRFPISFHVEIQTSSDSAPRAGRVLNISHGGVFVALSDFSPSVGDTIHFSIEVPLAAERVRLQGSGIIRWIQAQRDHELPSGFGIEFLPLEPDSAEILNQLLKAQQIALTTAREEEEARPQPAPQNRN